jgi:hypothetical protein
MDSVERPSREGFENCFSEDRFGTSGAMAWILDGASSVSPGLVRTARSDADWIVDHLDNELRALSDRPEPLKELVARALHHVALLADDEWEGARPEVPPSAALGVVRHVGDHTEFFVLADVSVILRTEAAAVWLIDRRVDEHNAAARRELEEAVLEPEITFAQISERTRPLLAEPRRSMMNKPDGYWAASIDEAAADHALTGTIDGAEEVILATDGFIRALDLFGLVSSPEQLFTSDFRALAGSIRAIERGDPDTIAYPRWSVSDDICAHRLRWVD